MTAKVRRALIWGGMFLLAFASGSVLGRFTVSGLAGGARSLPDSSDVQNFWAAQDRGRTDGDAVQAAAPPPVSYAREPLGNHVCEGCDAGETRDQLRIQSLGGAYAEDDAPADSGDEGAAPALARAPSPPAAVGSAGD